SGRVRLFAKASIMPCLIGLASITAPILRYHAPPDGTASAALALISSDRGGRMRFHFPIIIIDEDFRSENTSGLGIRALATALEKEGVEVLGVTSYGDLSSFAQQQSRASAFILSIDDEEFAKDEAEATIAGLRAFVQEIRFRNA